MTLAITLTRLSRRLCLVSRASSSRTRHRNALTKKAWEDAVQGLGKRRVSVLHTTVTGFWQKTSIKKHAFSQNDKSGWPVLILVGAAITFNFCRYAWKKGFSLARPQTYALHRTERTRNSAGYKRGTQVTGFPVILSMRLGLSKTRLDRVVYRQLNGLYREHTSLAERLFPHPRRPRGSQWSRKRRNLRSGVFFFFFFFFQGRT